jgi:hypothetical protein
MEVSVSKLWSVLDAPTQRKMLQIIKPSHQTPYVPTKIIQEIQIITGLHCGQILDLCQFLKTVDFTVKEEVKTDYIEYVALIFLSFL